MFGWQGRVLRVDLHRGEVREESLDPQVARDFIGGRGLGIYYLLKELDPKCDPLSPDNLLVMATGPLTGTTAPTGSRYMITTKSPLTGAITCANAGGFFPAALKKSGFDAVIFTGRSEKPVYLYIHGGRGELRPADHLWGKTTHETDTALKAETGPRVKTAVIGPAGEKLAPIASVMNDRHRAAGRSGVGAVLGSKNLKGVAVLGDGQVPVYNPEALKKLNTEILKKFKDTYKDEPPPLRTYGTAVTAIATNHFGVLPTRNFQTGTFEGVDGIHGRTLTEKYLKAAKACFACPIACGRGTKVEEPGFEGEGEGPEYETVYAFGSNCGVDNLAAITKANYLCNELGLDTISLGATIACAMELFERGLIPESDIGRPLKFGDAHAIVDLTRLAGNREGFGRLLSQGSRHLAAHYGLPELAMVAKGQEFAGYDPRAEQGMGLAYATSPIGGSHMRGDPAYPELLGVPFPIDPLTWEDKPQIIKDWQDAFSIIDSAGLCVFFTVRNLMAPTLDIKPVKILELLNAVTGAEYTLEELIKAGERIANAERVFLGAAGFSRKQDTLPPRILKEPMPDGPGKGFVCHLEEMLDPYYKIRGWDQNGAPTEEKLSELGLGWTRE
ncbi:MAG: aldehyde ferredoxin oxidoreductase family protein [Proteobacteria bacterium]|nr:aldehyde ferredoxin oxidoreductase family protein [Pseudomonadota bacterium]MBU1740621.1 aldehyde ferredoxin oxidoreductase family protein [Pseudomonadota bacterium]